MFGILQQRTSAYDGGRGGVGRDGDIKRGRLEREKEWWGCGACNRVWREGWDMYRYSFLTRGDKQIRAKKVFFKRGGGIYEFSQ